LLISKSIIVIIILSCSLFSQKADLVVLSDNLLQISPAKIKDVYVKSTIVGGKIVYQAK